MLLSFTALIALGIPAVNLNNLLFQDYSAIIKTIPIMLVALVYHNIVPVICAQLNYKKENITKAIALGSFIPLLMFLSWDFVILGIAPVLSGDMSTFDPVQLLRTGGNTGGSGTTSALISTFSEAAIITSFIGFVIGLLDFFNDAISNTNKVTTAVSNTNTSLKSNKISTSSSTAEANVNDSDSKSTTPSNLAIYGLVLLPPTAVAIADPTIFRGALDYAGTFGISLLFGAIPALMALQMR